MMQLQIAAGYFQAVFNLHFIIASPKKSAKVHPPQCLDLALPGRQTHLLDPVVVISHIDRCVLTVLSMFIGLKRSKPPISGSTLTGLVDVWGEDGWRDQNIPTSCSSSKTALASALSLTSRNTHETRNVSTTKEPSLWIVSWRQESAGSRLAGQVTPSWPCQFARWQLWDRPDQRSREVCLVK